MIQNAKDIPLATNPGGLPNVSDALSSWFQPLTFTTIVKAVEGFQVVETQTEVTFRGVRQPFTPQQLLMKPEGQRQWKWQTIHSHPDLVLDIDDIITFLGENYRVMHKADFKEYGYVLYEIVEDYTS